MKFEQNGNLGKVDLLQRHLMLKLHKDEIKRVILSEDEIKEIDEQLSAFRHLLSNVFLWENTLKNDQYCGLVSIIKELEPYYRDYKPE